MEQQGSEVHLRIENAGELRVSLVDGEVIGLEPILKKVDGMEAMEVALAVNGIGEALEKVENYAASTRVYLVAFELALKSKQHLNATAILINVGLSQKRANQFDDALQIYERATAALVEPQTLPRLESQRVGLLSNVLFNTAQLQLARSEPLEAERAAEWCLDLLRYLNDDHSKSLCKQCELILQDAQSMRKTALPKAALAIGTATKKTPGRK